MKEKLTKDLISMYYRDFYYNKVVNSVIKAKKPVQLRLKVLNNNVIDDFILTGEFNDAYVLGVIKDINNPSLREYLSKRLNKTLLDKDDYLNITAARNIVEDVNTTISTTELNRIRKNIDYVDNILNKADMDIAQYETLINELPKTTSRISIVQESITNKELPSPARDAEIKSWYEQGGSYKTRYTYKELDTLSQDIERYSINRFEQEQALMQNREAIRMGGDEVYTSKTWCWSTLENTRHRDMDNVTIPIHEKFEVTNEQNGDVDFLMFPGDYVNCVNDSNVVNCQCSVLYNSR